MHKEYAYAKINIALDVVRKNDNGYHDLKMIMIPLELADELTFSLSEDINVTSSVDIEDNGIKKAATLLKETYHIDKGAHITCKKEIPIGAGLGGGSADIAATLRGLNILWELNLSYKELENLALKLGSDTVFCLYNKPAYVYGRGEHLMFIQSPGIDQVYLFYPHVQVSTKRIFDTHAINFEHKRFNRLFTLYINENYREFFRKTYNVLTQTTLNEYPELVNFSKKMTKLSPLSRMSGSGSTFFIPIFNQSEHKIHKKCQKLGIEPIKTRVKD